MVRAPSRTKLEEWTGAGPQGWWVRVGIWFHFLGGVETHLNVKQRANSETYILNLIHFEMSRFFNPQEFTL